MFRASLRPSSGGRTAFHCLRFLSCCSCWDVGESGGKMCALWGGCCKPPDSPASQQLQQDRNHRQWNAVRPPDDGRKDARNMLRNNWLPINNYLLHLVGSRLYFLQVSICSLMKAKRIAICYLWTDVLSRIPKPLHCVRCDNYWRSECK